MSLKLDIPIGSSRCQQDPISTHPDTYKPVENHLHGEQSDQAIASLHGKQYRAEEIFQVVRYLEDLWTHKLKNCSELSALAGRLYRTSTFRSGLEVLRELLQSRTRTPTTINEIFQLNHIAFACAFLLYAEDGCYSWELLYQDTLIWGRLIIDQEDRNCYLKIANLLWSAPCLMLPPLTARLSYAVNTEFARQPPNSLLGHQSESSLFDETYGDGTLSCEIRSGKLMRSCTLYLDGKQFLLTFIKLKLTLWLSIECLLAEVDDRRLHGMCATMALQAKNQIVDVLFKPLLQNDVLEPYHAHVLATLAMLNDGLLFNIREVEVKLIAGNSVSSFSPSYAEI